MLVHHDVLAEPALRGTLTTKYMPRKTIDAPALAPPWRTGYAFPDYLAKEPLGRGVFRTKYTPRKTVSTLIPKYLGGLGDVDLIYVNELLPGDANHDFSFDQLDIVQVQQADKYLTGQPATWGEGDWNGGPGGYPGEPPAGNGLFDQKDA